MACALCAPSKYSSNSSVFNCLFVLLFTVIDNYLVSTAFYTLPLDGRPNVVLPSIFACLKLAFCNAADNLLKM